MKGEVATLRPKSRSLIVQRVVRCLHPRTRGQALAEFALIVPVFMLLLLIGIDFGRLFFSYVEVTNAAREGAAYGATNPTDLAGITARATQETNVQSQRGEGALAVTTECANNLGATISCVDAPSSNGIGNAIKVTAGEKFTFLTPLINGAFGGDLDIGASASATVLGYAPSPGNSSPAGCARPMTAVFTAVVTDLTLAVDPAASQPNSGTCAIVRYQFDWGDGTTSVSVAVASSHTYAAAGTYSVRLTVSNSGGSLSSPAAGIPVGVPPPTPTPDPSPTASSSPSPTATASPTVAPCTKPTASFTYRQGTGNSSKTYEFTDTSQVADTLNCPITDWRWDFGDGTVTNAINPTHTYGDNRSHLVTLKVTNSAGSSSYQHTQ
jgi:PKD repeat protein